MAKIIGIDLGTTNSVVSVMEGGEPVVIANEEGGRTTPSVVAFEPSGNVLVGQQARRQAITNAQNTIFSAKRFIGRKYDEVEHERKRMPFKTVRAPNGDVQIEARGKVYPPPEISSRVLMKLKKAAEDYLGEPVDSAVITVPAYFNDSQRQATKDAGRIAGLDVKRIVNEPTAAALAYGLSKGGTDEHIVAVYDLGGGTFDISILEVAENVVEVISTNGDTLLGGDDFDERIIRWLLEEFKKDSGIDVSKDKLVMQRLKDAAEKAECELSTGRETDINLPFIVSTGHTGATHLQRTFRRETLESLCSDLIDRCIDLCRQTLEDARIEVDEIEDVILVGGMTRMPRVQEAVQAFFGREPCKGVHPDEVVALGAAVQGAALVDTATQMVLLDVTPHALGIMTYGENFEELIPMNTTVPTSRSKIFTTSRDNQTAVKILVMQGETAKVGPTDLLGEFVLTGLRRAPKGQVEIDVTFSIDGDGIVSVSARDLETNQQQSIQVTSSSGLTKEEVGKMVEEAKEFLVDRPSSDEFTKLTQEANKLISEIESMFPRVEMVVASSDFGRDAIGKARSVVERCRDVMARKDVSGLRGLMESLARTHRMFKGVVARPQG